MRHHIRVLRAEAEALLDRSGLVEERAGPGSPTAYVLLELGIAKQQTADVLQAEVDALEAKVA